MGSSKDTTKYFVLTITCLLGLTTSAVMVYPLFASNRSVVRQVSPPDSEHRKKRQQAKQLHKEGVLAWQENATEKAEILFRKAIEQDPANPFILSSLANLLYEMSRNAEAAEIYREIIRPKPGQGSTFQRDPVLLLRYAVVCAELGDNVESHIAYTEALKYLERSNFFPDATGQKGHDKNYLKGLLLYAEGMQLLRHLDGESDRKAAQKLEQAAKAHPNLRGDYIALAEAHLRLKNKNKVRQSWEEAAKSSVVEVRQAVQAKLKDEREDVAFDY